MMNALREGKNRPIFKGKGWERMLDCIKGKEKLKILLKEGNGRKDCTKRRM